MLLTSNNNNTQGKVYGKRTEYDYTPRSNAGGCCLVVALLGAFAVIVTVIYLYI